MRIIFFLCVAAIAALGQEKSLVPSAVEASKPELRLWKFSTAALIAASAADVASSYGRCCEANPILASSDRTFGNRGLAIKSASVGGQLLLQYMVVRKNPRLAKVLSYVNFGSAGALTAVAVRNYRIPQPASLR
jgi:hypothetical protein